MNSTVSIAMATYNGEKYLRELLDSLYNQTRLPDEVVVTDDCSTDRTSDILEEYHQKYGLKYCINEKSLGVTKNFEKALSLTSGDYIMICDQDDVWLKNKIELSLSKILELGQDNMPGLICGQVIDVDKNLNVIIDKKLHTTLNWEANIWGMDCQGCTIMMNRKLKEMIIPIPLGVPYDGYIAKIAALCGFWFNIGDSLLLYRRHEGNVTGDISKQKKIYFKSNWQYPFLIGNHHFELQSLVYQKFKDVIIKERKAEADILFSLHKKKSKLARLLSVYSIKNKRIKQKIRSIIAILYNKNITI